MLPFVVNIDKNFNNLCEQIMVHVPLLRALNMLNTIFIRNALQLIQLCLDSRCITTTQ